MNKERTVTYGDITVVYEGLLDGGGTSFGQQYVPVVRDRFKHVGHVFEFCSGPGFIGFSLLAHGLCDKLTLADINPDAVALCKETVRRNNLEDRVSVYLSDVLKDIPASEQWDLVVGNPPHFVAKDEEEYQSYIRLYDPHLRIHEDFYDTVSAHLTPNGVVMLQENKEGMTADMFTEMVERNGLTVQEVFVPTPEELKDAKAISDMLPKHRPNYAKLLDPKAVYKYVSGKLTRQLRKENPYYFLWVTRKGS